MTRVSPPEEARELPGPQASSNVTRAPRSRRCKAVQPPKAPAPITAMCALEFNGRHLIIAWLGCEGQESFQVRRSPRRSADDALTTEDALCVQCGAPRRSCRLRGISSHTFMSQPGPKPNLLHLKIVR